MGRDADFVGCHPPAFGNECAGGDVATLEQRPQSLATLIIADDPIRYRPAA
jgi:hypothetical protein